MTTPGAEGAARARHLLVVANETVGGHKLIDAVRKQAERGPLLVTVITPVTEPREGYVVYEDTRRAAAGRRLERTLQQLREAGIAAHGFVVEADPLNAVRDTLAELEPQPDQIMVSTHPQERSGWLRRNVVDLIRRAARPIPVEHVVVDLNEDTGEKNVLVVANETVVGGPLLQKIRERAAQGPSSFLIICPQSDPTVAAHPEAERRLRRALASLRGQGIDAHGQIAHPDPYTAAVHAVRDERVDEIIVSTFPKERSGWLRKDLVERLRETTKLPVTHVVVDAEPATVNA
jgi:predicted deacetylase